MGISNQIQSFTFLSSLAPRRPPAPPTTLDRVSKWFEGFKPPKDLFKSKKNRRKNNRRKLKRPSSSSSSGGLSSSSGLDYDLYDTGEDHNLIFFSGEASNEAGQPLAAGSTELDQEYSGEFDFLDVLNSIRSNETM